MPALEPAVRALFEAPNFGFAATTRKDGTILNVPIWIDVEGDEIILNSEDGRAWPANLRRTGHITITVANGENPYEFASVTGHLAGEEKETASDHADVMAQKYLGQDKYPFHQPGDVRVKFRIAPDRVFHYAAG